MRLSKNSLPVRDDVILKIDAMMHATETREAVAAWAIAIIDDENVEVTDSRIWKVLKNLGSSDLLGDDRPYLYTNEDFSAWKAELK